MANNIFENAITQILKNDTKIFEPVSFNKYLEQNKINNIRTSQNISIDSYEKLNKELKENNIMILRLGNDIDTRETQFALIKIEDIKDYFLIDNKIFTRRIYQLKV